MKLGLAPEGTARNPTMIDANSRKAHRTAPLRACVRDEQHRRLVRRKGELSTKLNAAPDAKRRPPEFFMNGGQVSDYVVKSAAKLELPRCRAACLLASR